MCVYNDCLYPCFDKKEHHARYANMRRNKYSEKKINEVKTRSSKVNWNVVNYLNIEDKTVIINRMKNKKDKYIHDHNILKD